MDTQEILNSFDYDFDDLSFNIDMSNKLFCTFTAREELDTLLEKIKSNYIVLYNKIFVLECQDQEEFICTYNVDFNNIGDFLDNTILVHRKKQTNTLYTINALNQLIMELNDGVLDKSYMIPWEDYKNSVLLTKENKLQILRTKLHNIVEVD
tara:strand:- start:72 stop:527 length:456 start_codon:yes stop_codon:yes gene_type:complete